ncbi:hypothetical protein PUY80_08415 [Plantibacter flavus]|uniref:hypothetical protein n=1 Tax=Plantibacter flavus TaxID=150123 RepID=UPI002378C322|nr:hypothetical protein [Plantibacter flavus]MDD9152597.1 hypothetical protein [Plantibacter flavus]
MNISEALEPAQPKPRGLLQPHEEVLFGRFLRDPDEERAVYGDDSVSVWRLNALGRPANASRGWGKVDFGELQSDWLIAAKDLAVVLLNPEHPALVSHAAHLRVRKPIHPRHARCEVNALREYYTVARWGGFPVLLADWKEVHFHEALAILDSRGRITPGRLRSLERVPRLLHSYRRAIPTAPQATLWRLPRDSPFAGRWAPADGEIRTQPVEPDVYFKLLSAGLAYVEVFGPDIARAVKERQILRNRTTVNSPIRKDGRRDYVTDFRTFFDDPRALVPLWRHPDEHDDDDAWNSNINWEHLVFLVTGNEKQSYLVAPGRAVGAERRRLSIAKARSGAWTIGSFAVPIARLEGQPRPWIAKLDKGSLNNQVRMLRTACYIVIAGLTMMRDSEVQEIRRGSLTMHMGTPALRSALVKGTPDNPIMHWWISPAVATAVQLMESISLHPTHLFASSRETRGKASGGISVALNLAVFRRRVNEEAHRTGLDLIPEGRVAPHMLRRTMALITEYERGGQLAASHQLKHAHLSSRSNALTGAYTATTQRWATELKQHDAIQQAQIALDDLALHPHNTVVGPGAPRTKLVLKGVGTTLDRKARARLLAQNFPDLHVGTANLCLGDRSVAECLPHADRDGSVSVKPTACDPSRCTNSVVLPLHEELWRAEEASLKSMLTTPRLSAHMKATLTSRLQEVVRVTRQLE